MVIKEHYLRSIWSITYGPWVMHEPFLLDRNWWCSSKLFAKLAVLKILFQRKKVHFGLQTSCTLIQKSSFKFIFENEYPLKKSSRNYTSKMYKFTSPMASSNRKVRNTKMISATLLRFRFLTSYHLSNVASPILVTKVKCRWQIHLPT